MADKKAEKVADYSALIKRIDALDSKWDSKFQGINDELSKLVRRVDSLANVADLIYDDRSILEDIQQNITGLREGTHLARDHQERAIKDVKAEIIDTKLTVEDKIGQVSDKVEDNLSGIAEAIEKKKPIKQVKSGLFKRFRRG